MRDDGTKIPGFGDEPQDWQVFVERTVNSMPGIIVEFEKTYFPPAYSRLESCSRCGVRVYPSVQKQHNQWHWALSLLFFVMTARMEAYESRQAEQKQP